MRKISASCILLLTGIALVLGVSFDLTLCAQGKGRIMEKKAEPISTVGVNDLTITVVYDNNPYKEGLKTAWGFSCLVTGTEKTILFDTGGDGELLLNNMKKLAIEPKSIDIVVLSHIHGDHTGGLDNFLQKNSDVTVYLPESFPRKFKDGVKVHKAVVVDVEQCSKICEDVYSTGQLGVLIKEQSLIIRTNKGLVIVTGCAHPGIAKIVNVSKGLMKDDILLVMGGFHLEWVTKGKIENIISAFKQMGVRYVGPSHCTGERARALFEKHFDKNYMKVGVGKVINLVDLK
jgi:7,8-dihydropterin-6-yl-methyl-4-(beta-D-ribofuranosyl)aminobenzene 5'-phosphate synthase